MMRAQPEFRRRPRPRGDRARLLAGGAFLVALAVAPTMARADCVALAPGFDGVLRLDTGRAAAVPCGGPLRRYAAAPSGRSAAPAPPAKSATPGTEAPAAAAPATSPSVDDFARLREQTTRLQDELARLNDETAGLRAETRSLREQLARREQGEAAAVDRGRAGKVESRLGPTPSEAAAPKGDMLKPSQPKDETRAASSVGAGDAGKSAADQAEFERRKGVAERAWNELLDFAARMRKDLSGKTE